MRLKPRPPPKSPLIRARTRRANRTEPGAVPMPPLIGLTGAIAAGKSAALQALADLGAETLSTDAVTHELLSGEQVRDILVERWGEDVAPEGALDRRRIGAIVFDEPEELSWLEGILHPMVGERVAAWRAELDPGAPLGVVEVPLLFEGTMAGAFDATLVVATEDGLRAARAGERGTEALAAREERQLSQEEKIARADFVVRNDGSPDDLRGALAELWPRLLGAGGRESSSPARRTARPRKKGFLRSRGAHHLFLALAIAGIIGFVISRIDVGDAIKEVTLPLRHDDIIRKQAAEKDLDPALIAAVIYHESKFRRSDLDRRRAGPDADHPRHR